MWAGKDTYSKNEKFNRVILKQLTTHTHPTHPSPTFFYPKYTSTHPQPPTHKNAHPVPTTQNILPRTPHPQPPSHERCPPIHTNQRYTPFTSNYLHLSPTNRNIPLPTPTHPLFTLSYPPEIFLQALPTTTTYL